MAIIRRYFDYNASAPLSQSAQAALLASFNIYGNPSSVHQEGRAAKALLQKARRTLATHLAVDSQNIIFTSGASEAAATLLTPYYKMGRAEIYFSKLYLSAGEHPAIATGGRFSSINICTIKLKADGCLCFDHLEERLKTHDNKEGLPLVAVQAANSETGVIQPLIEVASLVKQYGGVLIVDAAQYFGKLPLNISQFGGDFFILSGHKIGAPKGIGALVALGNSLMPTPLIAGGGQENGFRGGTQTAPLAAAFAAAISDNEAYRSMTHIETVRNYLEEGLKACVPHITIYGQEAPRLGNTSYFSIPQLKAETAQIGFDLAGFATSAGSACSSGKVTKSSILTAMGVQEHSGALRVSLGGEVSFTDIDAFLQTLKKMLK